MRFLTVALAALVLTACAGETVQTVQLREPAPVQLTASEYWDAHPSDLHDLCAELIVGGGGDLGERGLRNYRRSWSRQDYERAVTDPPAPDAFAEAVARCSL